MKLLPKFHFGRGLLQAAAALSLYVGAISAPAAFDFISLAKGATGIARAHTNEPHGNGSQDSLERSLELSRTVALPSEAGSFNACAKQFPHETAPLARVARAEGATPLCYERFAVLYSPVTKGPVYSAQRLTRERIADAGDERRTNVFFEDRRLSHGSVRLSDYRASGYDRGHMSAAADMPDGLSMTHSFSLTNMVPQAPENNRKAWADVEKATRQYVRRAQGNVYVFTGPVYGIGTCPIAVEADQQLHQRGIFTDNVSDADVIKMARNNGIRLPAKFDLDSCTIGNGLAVPTHLFKLVYDESTGRAWAHWVANTNKAKVGKPITYQELVRRTGLELLPNINPKS